MSARLKELGLEVDPDDKLPLSEAGEWASEKHYRLQEYIARARSTRKKWGGYGGRCAYVDLFSGPGRQYVEKTGEIINGSPLVAWTASKILAGASPFSEIYLADKRKYALACEKRLRTLGAPVTVAALSAIEAARVVARKLDPGGLHLVFVDPYGLKQLSWQIFEPLFELPRIDFIVHFSSQGLVRNLDRYFAEEMSALDDIAPGWRKTVKAGGKETMRGQFFEHWVSLFRPHGFKLARHIPLIENDTNAPLYRLVLLSRHELAEKLWNSVRGERDTTGDLFLS